MQFLKKVGLERAHDTLCTLSESREGSGRLDTAVNDCPVLWVVKQLIGEASLPLAFLPVGRHEFVVAAEDPTGLVETGLNLRPAGLQLRASFGLGRRPCLEFAGGSRSGREGQGGGRKHGDEKIFHLLSPSILPHHRSIIER